MTSQKTGLLFLAAAIVFALSISGTLTGEPGARPQAMPTSVAFVSLSKVMNAHKGLRGMEDEISAFIREGEAELMRMQKEMESFNDELMVYSPESKEAQEGKSEMERKELILKQRKRSLLMERDVKMGKAIKNAYADVERTVREYAVQQGIQAVMSYGVSSDQINSNRPEDILNWVSTVSTVWHDEQLDISDAIITIINGS